MVDKEETRSGSSACDSDGDWLAPLLQDDIRADSLLGSDSDVDNSDSDASENKLVREMKRQLDDRVEAEEFLRSEVDLEHYSVQWSRLAGVWTVF